MGAQCTAALIPFKLPNLNAKNNYDLMQTDKKIDQNKLNRIAKFLFNNDQKLIKQKRNLLEHLSLLQQNQKFTDPNFKIKGQRLSSLYDLKRKMMKLYTPENRPGLTIMQQQQVQFSYLSAVIFFLSQNKQFLRKKIILTEQINYDNHAYSVRLFCNGQEHIVVIDDIVPVTLNNNLKYSLLREKETWPVLLQKAWCKMIGGYEKAHGLSPQECFQQITGLPVFSVRIDTLNETVIYNELLKHQAMKNWLCVVAYRDTEFLKPGQVFVIQKIDDQTIILASPFTQNIKQSQGQNRQGYLKIKFHKFRQYFEYLIVGYVKNNYSLISKKLSSQKRQEKLYEINVKKQEEVSIRFTQFFNGYLDDAQKTNYEYSPLSIFQLYDSNGILHFCQGSDKIYSGVHSVYFTNNIFHNMNKGTYYLRLEVDWQHPNRINEGNIVIYASQKNVEIQQIKQTKKVNDLHRMAIDNPKSVIYEDEVDDDINHEYELRYIEKKTNILISLENKVEKLLCLELSFDNSQNFRVKYETLQGNKKVKVNLGPKQIKYLQILPEDLKKQFKIQPFTVKKLPPPHR